MHLCQVQELKIVPCNLKARLLLIPAIPYIFQAVDLLVVLLGVTKGRETQNSCLVTGFFLFIFSSPSPFIPETCSVG